MPYVSTPLLALAVSSSLQAVEGFARPSSSLLARAQTTQATSQRFASTLADTYGSISTSSPGDRIPIDESYPGLRRVHADPDVFVIEDFLDGPSCDEIIEAAKEKGTERSPVAYAGWTTDIKDLLGLAATGPVTWAAIIAAWAEAQGDEDASVLGLVLHSIRNYAVLFVAAAAAIAAFTKIRADGLQELRTSTSTTLDDMAMSGPRNFVLNAARLFGPSSADSDMHESQFFESPTVISYERDQSLAPHYDANRSADVEDANRGGQTLSTLLVYLNDVDSGGTTRFGRLPAAPDCDRQLASDSECLNIVPRKGDALLFFPADADGRFDERTEHEGRPAVDEKWIARIWRHVDKVPPPFGLSDESIGTYIDGKD